MTIGRFVAFLSDLGMRNKTFNLIALASPTVLVGQIEPQKHKSRFPQRSQTKVFLVPRYMGTPV